jgi:hypothetical protein
LDEEVIMPPALPDPGRCVVVGILNVTPDSFSDGGRYLDRDDAVAHGLALHAQGADLVDIGGESTRPGAQRVDAATEIAGWYRYCVSWPPAACRAAWTPPERRWPRLPSKPA